MKKFFGVNLLVGLMVFGLAAAVVAQEFVPGEILVKVNPGASSSMLASVAAPGALASAQVSKNTGVMVVELADGVAVTSAVALLANDPALEFAEPNYIQYATAIPNDPELGDQWAWGVIDAFDAWDVATGDANIQVNVIDTGIDVDHPDLVANVWVNAAEAAGSPGVDDDSNGYVDDINGWNAISNSGNPDDDHYHGTHCSGTIGAVTNNGINVAGVNWTTSLVGCKFLNSAGSGSSADAIECIDYIIDTNAAGSADIRVSSNSWGGGGYSAALETAIQAAVNAGILWVNAAGNDSNDNDCFGAGAYPSAYNIDGIISVASTTSTDSMSSFSNYGASTVDIGAPGSSIKSTDSGGGTRTISGTSMACPHVAGAAALALAVDDTLSVAELLEVVLCTGDYTTAMDGKVTTGMRLNLLGVVNGAGGSPTCADRDSDGVADYADNCPYVSNAGQGDSDGNGVGDDCEPDDCGGCF